MTEFKPLFEEKEKPLSWKFRVFALLMAFVLCIVALRYIAKRSREQSVRRKLKYFNPTITKGFWGKKVTWVGRDKPLTKKQLDKLVK